MGDGLMTSKETFKEYPVDSKLDTLFDFTKAIYERSCLQHEACDDRFRKLERRKIVDRSAAIGSGGIGGFIFMGLKYIFSKFLT